MKVCSVCKKEKSLNDFYKANNSKDGYNRRCKLCADAVFYKYISNPINLAKVREKSRIYYAKPEVKERQRYYRILKTFGISRLEYEEMLHKQNGVCAICSKTEDPNFRHKYLSVDHCHITGRIRGLLCSKCNHAIGLLQDDVSLLQSAVLYLKNK